MTSRLHKSFIVLVGLLFLAASGFAASPDPALLKAKKEAEAKGYIFFTSRDEIVARAKQEGKLRILSGLDSRKQMREAFVKKYPFLDVQTEEITGTDAGQRFILELKAGQVKGWDVVHVSSENYLEYPEYTKKFDILGMAQHGVLAVPGGMIDPRFRNILAMTSSVSIVAYNKKLVAPERVPSTWEDFLKPEFKGKKFLVDIRPHPYRSLVPLMGMEWVLNYCRRLAAQEPIWVRGQTRALTSMAAGEYALYAAVNYHSTVGVMKKDPTGNLQYKVVEPVPVRLSETEAVLNSAAHPHAGLLWLEFVAAPEGQRIIDEHEPLKSSLFAQGSAVEKLIREKKLSVLGWDDYADSPELVEKIVAAFGFPKAEK